MEKTPMRQSSLGVQANLTSKVALKQIKQLSSNNKPQSFIPFIFRNKKNQKLDKENYPAPGQYQCKSIFSNKNERDYLAEQFHVVLENTKKIKESVFFKSTAHRFNYSKNSPNPLLSHSYRLSQHSQQQNSIQKAHPKIKNKTLTIMNEHRAYPSIPDKSIKFGYVQGDQGKLHKIVKTDEQLLKEKNDMKDYIKKFKIQQHGDGLQFNLNLIREKNQLLLKLKRRTKEQTIDNKQRDQSVSVSEKSTRKPLKSSSLRYNEQKIAKIIKQKKILQDKLGPGCYEIKNIIQTENKKPERYQFFSSSSERFPQSIYQQNTDKQNAKDIVKKNEIQQKINDARKFQIDKLREGIKRQKRGTHNSERASKQVNSPGPADYEPNQKFTKVDVGKANCFMKSNRFDFKKPSVQISKSKSIMVWKMSNEKEKIIKQMHQKLQSQNKQRYTQIMKKNNGLIQKSKDLDLKQKEAKEKEKFTDYELCSWSESK